MSSAGLAAPAVVYLLADHLDAALAAGEDLLKSTLSWNAGDARSPEGLTDQRREEREALDAARALEMVLLARVLKSRETAHQLAKTEPEFRLVARLYTSGTDIVAEAASELSDETANAFETGDGMTAYLRSRGLIAEDAAAPLEAASLTVTEQFLVAGRMNLGALLDLVAMFLDTLETHYELYEQPARAGQTGTAQPASPTTGAVV
ncbi:MAG: hypothetical protein JNN24_05830 [Hyphomicrobium zavarzinii]|jgi:hypothetical protein|uniref:hypothetical protein n=1 Tax=Hyphomicrobium zavarzinii TaxID=48292 RepID=UPI001A3FDA75|nr:hypothetical protein [Hyphomicrobium zavarzinii]MBL8845272.1 hypothetical protein [Hyphomicrobium zavarzinii]